MISAKDLPAPDDRYPVRRALLSVSDKTGLADFGRRLDALGVELLSTGGTARALREAGVPVTDVASVTGFPEILGGRVKSLHPAIHGGILARRTDPEDLAELAEHGIGAIDLVVVNLYPFREATAGGATDAVAAENVDIGGPGMLRAAAKNFAFVAAVVDPADYDADRGRARGQRRHARHRDAAPARGRRLRPHGRLRRGHRRLLRRRLGRRDRPPTRPTTRPRRTRLPDIVLRRPPQGRRPALRREPAPARRALRRRLDRYEMLHGKALSFNNLIDLTAALNLIAEFAAGRRRSPS